MRNDDGRINLGDAICVLGYLFANGGPLVAPFRDRGHDPTADGIMCE